MQKDDNYLGLKKFSKELGLDLFGVADITAEKNDFLFSENILGKIKNAVCLGLGLSKGILDDIENGPTRLYFHHYRAVNNLLDQSALKLSRYIEKKGFIAIPVPASQIIDWKTQKAHLSHKKIER